RVCLRLPAYSASAKVICFIIEKLGDWCPVILPNQEVFFRVSLAPLCQAVIGQKPTRAHIYGQRKLENYSGNHKNFNNRAEPLAMVWPLKLLVLEEKRRWE
ncbi:hypothetical protein, partial [Pseudomonas sp. RL_5y_Pfl2_73]|uniref:hypothetical protein n=1 Tax=Pseudomonas sp. RL_5y_Pfl2_73 TaxID=3088713 RepID=UPI0030D9CDC1